jgi:hypothetical protein
VPVTHVQWAETELGSDRRDRACPEPASTGRYSTAEFLAHCNEVSHSTFHINRRFNMCVGENSGSKDYENYEEDEDYDEDEDENYDQEKGKTGKEGDEHKAKKSKGEDEHKPKKNED